MIPITTSEQKSLLAICIVFAILPTVSFGLRICAQRMREQRQPWNASESAMLAGLIAAYGQIACNLTGIGAGGLGEHKTNITISQLLVFYKCIVALQVTWYISLCCTKISITLFYMEIFSTRNFRIAAYFAIAASVTVALIGIMTTILICHPLAFFWDPNIPGGYCGNMNSFWLATGLLNIFTDLYILSLPIPMLWKLQIPKTTKAALFVIFGLGLFVSLIGVIRLKFLLEIDWTGDVTWTICEAITWSFLEATIGIIIGCLPTLAPIFQRLVPGRSKKRGLLSKTSCGNQSKKDRNNFRELEDVLPLTSLRTTATSTVPSLCSS